MATTYRDQITGTGETVAWKAAVRVATLANITLSGLQTVDGVTVEANDRVLVKAQTDAAENGIYIANSGAWLRTLDFDSNRDIAKGTRVVVLEGATQANKTWQVTSDNPITVGTDDITFANVTVEGVQAEDITEIVVLTEAAYNLLSPPNATTLYVVVG